MSIELNRVNVKLYLEDEDSISNEIAFRIFNRWISETTEEVLIDVADYNHVPKGPKTLLVGHESDYVLDNTDGRMGLRYGRKRPIEGNSRQRLEAALTAALSACQRLEEAPEAEGRVRFRGGELQLSIRDRLNAPNTAESLSAMRDDLLAVLGKVYGDAEVELSRDEDDRQCLTIQVRAKGEFSVSDMARAVAA